MSILLFLASILGVAAGAFAAGHLTARGRRSADERIGETLAKLLERDAYKGARRLRVDSFQITRDMADGRARFDMSISGCGEL
jgi:hypothetical protein